MKIGRFVVNAYVVTIKYDTHTFHSDKVELMRAVGNSDFIIKDGHLLELKDIALEEDEGYFRLIITIAGSKHHSEKLNLETAIALRRSLVL